jgi:hypothetical protein
MCETDKVVFGLLSTLLLTIYRVPAARYDGQVFVKPPEVLTRDRLLGAYEVKPALQRLRGSLVGTGAALLVVALTLAGLLRVDEVNEVGPTGE